LNISQFALGYGETKVVEINFSSPDVAQDSSTSQATSKVKDNWRLSTKFFHVKERASYVELFVYSYKVKIVTPNKHKPNLGNVNPGDILLAKVNITSNSTSVTTRSVTFNISIYNSSTSAASPS